MLNVILFCHNEARRWNGTKLSAPCLSRISHCLTGINWLTLHRSCQCQVAAPPVTANTKILLDRRLGMLSGILLSCHQSLVIWEYILAAAGFGMQRYCGICFWQIWPLVETNVSFGLPPAKLFRNLTHRFVPSEAGAGVRTVPNWGWRQW
jgi:hypothetical protein